MLRSTKALLLAALLALPMTGFATDNDPTPPGGGGLGGLICRFGCYLRYGSCEISGGDDDTIPLKDPFCEANRAACLSRCAGDSGGPIRASLLPGEQAPAMCPAQPACVAVGDRESVG